MTDTTFARADAITPGTRIYHNDHIAVVERTRTTDAGYVALTLDDGITTNRWPEEDVRIDPARVQGFICQSRELTWGWGATPDAAIRQARKAAGGRGARKGDRVVYALPAGAVDAYVDQMGSIVWTWTDDAPDKTVRGIVIEEPPK